MGKRLHIEYNNSKPTVGTVDEKQRIREKVLKVFRARAHSPGGGPAIIIKDSPTSVDVLPTVICSSSSSDDNDRMEFMPAVQRKKNQKRRGDRGRKRHHKGETSVVRDDIVTQHLKKAQKVSVQRANSSAQEDTSYSMITQNRITRHLGLFNCGKKSGRILRAPLVIPDRVQQLTREEFFKIVGHQELDSSTPVPCGEERRATPLQLTCLSQPSPAVSTRSSVCDQDLQFPRCLQLQEFEESCLPNLLRLKVYENRDLAKDTSRDLKKLFKSSDEAELQGSWPDSSSCSHSSSLAGLSAHTSPPFKRQAIREWEFQNSDQKVSSSANLEALSLVPVDMPSSSSVAVVSTATQHVLSTASQCVVSAPTLDIHRLPAVEGHLNDHLCVSQDVPPSAPLNASLPVPLDVHSTLQSCEEVLQTDVGSQDGTTRSRSVARGGLLDDARGLLLQDCLAVQSNAASATSLPHSGDTGFCQSGDAYSSRNCQPKTLYPEEVNTLQTLSVVQQGGRVVDELGFPCMSTHVHSAVCSSSEYGGNGCCRHHNCGVSPHLSLPCPHHLPALACRVGMGPQQRIIAQVNSNVISEYVQQLPVIHHPDMLPSPPPSVSTPCRDHFHCQTADVNPDYLELSHSQLDADLGLAKARLPHPLLERGVTSPPSNLLCNSPSPPKLYPRKLY